MNGADWITFHLPPDIDLSGAGIYFWEVGADTYVGKATRLDNRPREYLNNVRKILPVQWRALEACPPGPPLLKRERHWIAALSPTLNGPLGQRRSGT